MAEPSTHPARRGPRRIGFERPDAHDPYRAPAKAAEPAACPDCGAVQEAGRWRWREALPGSHQLRCPACRRLRDRLPAGEVHLSGDFLAIHRDEVMARLRHVAEQAQKRHVLQRLMAIDENDREVHITTTSAHLARTLGRALQQSFAGWLDLDAQAKGSPRVRWSR